jgi:steroid 5-alpha reductase family enzyme
MSFLTNFLTTGIVIFSLMVFLWVVSLILKNSSIVDIFWGAGFVISAWTYFLLTPEGFFGRKFLLVVITTIWGLRLTIHILVRNWGKSEDYRYQKWRTESGRIWWIKSLFQVFFLQGILMWVISAPLLAAQMSASPARLTVLDLLGVLLWAVGFFFEAAGDFQLTRFKSNPANRGKVLATGVWRLSRHPNYFGDSAQWWGFYFIALAAGGWWTVFSPVIMTLFLIKISGVALLEKTLKNTKPGYKEYVESTSAFIPWPPKKVTHKDDKNEIS